MIRKNKMPREKRAWTEGPKRCVATNNKLKSVRCKSRCHAAKERHTMPVDGYLQP